MSTAEQIKLSLHQLIDGITDESRLKVVHSALQNDGDWWDELTEADRKSVETGLNQLKNGETIHYSEVKKKADALLRRNGKN